MNKRILTIFFSFLIMMILILNHQKILSKHNPIDAEVLVIEGWLPSYDLELLSKMDLTKYKILIITGIRHPHPNFDPPKENIKLPVTIYRNGCLTLNKDYLKKISSSSDSIYTISIFASGTSAYQRFPLFFLSINDSIIGNRSVHAHSENYIFHKRTKILESFYLYFNNDLRYNSDDRNLRIDSIMINGVAVPPSSGITLTYDDEINPNQFINHPFRSNAERTMAYLKAIGLTHHFILTDTIFKGRNKTLVAAKSFYTFLNRIPLHVNAVNIVSVHGHSRRTHLAYRTFNKNIKVGIISLDDSIFQPRRSKSQNLTLILDEYSSLVITFFQRLLMVS